MPCMMSLQRLETLYILFFSDYMDKREGGEGEKPLKELSSTVEKTIYAQKRKNHS